MQSGLATESIEYFYKKRQAMCSGIFFVCEDGSIVFGRTMEYSIVLPLKTHSCGDIVGTSSMGHFIDGVNSRKLLGAAFYFEPYDDYAPYEEAMKHLKHGPGSIDAIPSMHVVEYFLKRANDVNDIRRLAPHVIVTDEVFVPLGFVLPLHWIFIDASGASVVLECTRGQFVIYDNPFGIFTNVPPFPTIVAMTQERLKDLSNMDKVGYEWGHGSGALGLPGDMTSPSRFERLAFAQKYAHIPKTAKEGIQTVFHVLNGFDIVKGTVIFPNPKTGGYAWEFTQWTVAYDLSAQTGFYKTYENQQIVQFPKDAAFAEDGVVVSAASLPSLSLRRLSFVLLVVVIAVFFLS